ncbi:MAG: VWA domain-containing protein [Synergistaceae bacterium]|jgi:Ca-activated chloride channel family protein|nr:VWA domain-containing protein [Synergistaceae bacterium]
MKKIFSAAILTLTIFAARAFVAVDFSYGTAAAATRYGSIRYEMASIVARGLDKMDISKVSSQDRGILETLVLEFWDELESMGVDVKRALSSITGKADATRTVSADAKQLGPMNLVTEQWVYDAIAQLASRGVLPDFPDASYQKSMTLNSVPKMRLMYPAAAPQQAMADRSFAYSMSAGVAPETARYGVYSDNPVKQVATDPVATFGLDVNTTSYSNVRRFLNSGRLPPPDAVRVEELINYFPASAQDRKPERLESSPFYAAYELAPCPWDAKKTLLWLSLTAREVDYADAPPANLVFLVDVSGSMFPPDRLPLAKSALKMLVEKLRPSDKISLVTYAGATELVLPATSGKERGKILSAIDRLGAGGSTAGAAGLTLAYEQARSGFIEGGVNRILLCTDGDFNVGISSVRELKDMVTKERDGGVTLSILGFGTNNLNDEMMTQISTAGNGNYSYVDVMSEARKVLDEEMTSTLVTVAKDVKAQIEFNPANVAEYRQIGYEKRQLRNEDFDDDTVDAGDVGAGRRVTILYELTPTGANKGGAESRYREASPDSEKNAEVAYLKFRWKAPDGDKSFLAELPILKSRSESRFTNAGEGLRFSAAVAAYGQKLRGNPSLNETNWSEIESWADGARGADPYRAEFLQLVKLAGSISGVKQ